MFFPKTAHRQPPTALFVPLQERPLNEISREYQGLSPRRPWSPAAPQRHNLRFFPGPRPGIHYL